MRLSVVPMLSEQTGQIPGSRGQSSRLSAHVAALIGKVREQADRLADYYDRAEEEKRVVRHLMEQMVNAERLADPELEYWLSRRKACQEILSRRRVRARCCM